MKLALVTACLLIGAGVTGGLYWAFLNTPESTVWALLASAVLLAAALLTAGVTINAAILMWADGPSRPAVVRAARLAPSAIPAAIVVVSVWWLVAYVETWIAMRSGPINAWFIARLGWEDMSWMFAGISYAAAWARWVLAAWLAVWLMATLMNGGKHRVSIRRVLFASVWFVLFVALPWRYLVPWRPDGVPPTSLEMAFTVTKLALAAAIIATGAALIIREASTSRVAS